MEVMTQEEYDKTGKRYRDNYLSLDVFKFVDLE